MDGIKTKKRDISLLLTLMFLAIVAGGVAPNVLAADSQQWLMVGGQQFPLLVTKNRKALLYGRVLVLVPQLAEQRNSRSIQTLAKQLPNDGWHTILLPVDAASRGDVSDKPILAAAPTPVAEKKGAAQASNDAEKAGEDGAESEAAGAESGAESKGGRVKKIISIPVLLTLLDRVKTTLSGLPETATANTVIVAGREHALQLMELVATGDIAAPAGLVMIDAAADLEAEQQANFYGLAFPVLDLVTLISNKKVAQQRKYNAAENTHPDYRFVSIPPPAPNWVAGRDRITQRVRGWLKQRWGQD